MLPDRTVLKREHCSRCFIKELGSGLEAVFPLFYLLHFGLRKSYVPKAGERGVWNPAMGEIFIVLDANCVGIRARRALEGTLEWCHAEVRWLVLLMPLNVRMNLDENSDFWGLILYFLYSVLFFALCKHILRYYLFSHGGNISEGMYKTMRIGIQILAEGSINVTQDFIARFKLMTDCIVLVLSKGISIGYF